MSLASKPKIVVSAVNVTELGPLTILRDALTYLSDCCARDYEIIAFVHRQSLVGVPNIRYVELPQIKGSWLRRLKFEYYDLRKVSRELNADLWLSLHDMTPKVSAMRQAVYCHNANPFYPFHFRDARLDPKFGLFTLFYGVLYSIGIHRNTYIVVQQDWIRKEFKRRYGVDNVIVAHPILSDLPHGISEDRASRRDLKKHFFYPCYPRVFKNVEVALQAAAILEESGVDNFELWLTFDGSENSYARGLVKRYRGTKTARFLGILSASEVFERYRQADCLLFPSKLETWGLPISEFKQFRKPILAADLPYARETMGSYDQAMFFDPEDSRALAAALRSFIGGQIKFELIKAAPIAQPFSQDWATLFRLLLPPRPHSPAGSALSAQRPDSVKADVR